MYRNSNVLVTGGSSTHIARAFNIHVSKSDTLISPFQELKINVAAGALHNSGEVSDQPKCHPGTRVAIREHLEAWARKLLYDFPIIWLHGPAGSGKSSILRTIAHFLFQQKLILASFFFLRSAPGRNSSDRFIATIAYQIAISVPPTRGYIEEAIEMNPLIFSLSLWDQAEALIVSPILTWCRDNPTEDFRQQFPHIIVVDGLDECLDSNKQCKILKVLCRILQSLPIPLALLIASRPEHHIRLAFDLGDLNEYSTRLALDDSYNPDADIRKYLDENFAKIKQRHPSRAYLPISQWPSPNVVDNLIAKSSGQFIYASTVIKFVASMRHNPGKRLDIILGILNAGKLKPFEELDLLYSAIFLDIDENDRADVLRILGILLIPFKEEQDRYRTPAFLEDLLNLPAGEIRHLLFDLESLLTVRSDHDLVRFSHASLGDYLFDKSRSDQFWIDAGKLYADLAHQYTIQLSTSKGQSDFNEFFHKNVIFFFSNASPTPALREAIICCDLVNVVDFTWGERSGGKMPDITPTLIQGIRCSAFSDAHQLYIDKLVLYAKLIEPRIQFYFQDITLKRFLIAAAVSAELIFRDGRHLYYHRCLKLIFPVSKENWRAESQIWRAESQQGLDLENSSLALMQVIKALFDSESDPDFGYFINDNEYGDIALYLLKLLTEPPQTHGPTVLSSVTAEKCMSTIFPILLSKSPMRKDLYDQIRQTWPHRMHPLYLEFDSMGAALSAYVLKWEAWRVMGIRDPERG